MKQLLVSYESIFLKKSRKGEPISCRWSLSIPPESIRKGNLRFSGVCGEYSIDRNQWHDMGKRKNF